MDEQERFRIDDLYKNMPLNEIPWNSEQPPELLVELVESGRIKPLDDARGRPGRALDLGCGLGNYAIYLAGKGFEVTGIDFSPTAIKIAKENAKKKSVKCNFLAEDVTSKWPDLGKPFDFVYDWGMLHHIFPEKRGRYIENVHRVLKPGGNYLSVCFNEKDTAFKGSGKYRDTSLGTAVYLSSEEELRELFGRLFKIIDFQVLEISGKVMTHIFNYCLMERER